MIGSEKKILVAATKISNPQILSSRKKMEGSLSLNGEKKEAKYWRGNGEHLILSG